MTNAPPPCLAGRTPGLASHLGDDLAPTKIPDGDLAPTKTPGDDLAPVTTSPR